MEHHLSFPVFALAQWIFLTQELFYFPAEKLLVRLITMLMASSTWRVDVNA